MIAVSRTFHFSASHELPYHDGACKNLHGHNYKLEVMVKAPTVVLDEADSTRGMVIDFGVLKGIVNKHIINKLDHRHLNDIFMNPTAENMVIWMYNEIEMNLPVGVNVQRIKLWETENCFAVWEA